MFVVAGRGLAVREREVARHGVGRVGLIVAARAAGDRRIGAVVRNRCETTGDVAGLGVAVVVAAVARSLSTGVVGAEVVVASAVGSVGIGGHGVVVAGDLGGVVAVLVDALVDDRVGGLSVALVLACRRVGGATAGQTGHEGVGLGGVPEQHR